MMWSTKDYLLYRFIFKVGQGSTEAVEFVYASCQRYNYYYKNTYIISDCVVSLEGITQGSFLPHLSFIGGLANVDFCKLAGTCWETVKESQTDAWGP